MNLPLQINRDSVHNPNLEDSAASSIGSQPKYKTMPASASLGTGIMLNDIPEKQIPDVDSQTSRIHEMHDITRRSAEPESPRHFQAQMNERLKQLEQKSQQLLEHRSTLQKTSDEPMVSVSKLRKKINVVHRNIYKVNLNLFIRKYLLIQHRSTPCVTHLRMIVLVR